MTAPDSDWDCSYCKLCKGSDEHTDGVDHLKKCPYARAVAVTGKGTP